MASPKRIVISGYYGLANTGDEAVLASIVAGLREHIGGDLDILVLSATPGDTAATHGVRAAKRMDPRQVLKAIRECDLFISGGGSLLQDATSFASLGYYLLITDTARLAGRKVMVLGQGIGPLRRTASRLWTGHVLSRVPLITVRDAESADLLARIGVRRPRIEVTADPALALRPCPEEHTRKLLSEMGIRSDEDIVSVALREWPETPEIETAAVNALSALADKLPARLLLVPMQTPDDVRMALRIRQSLGDRVSFLPEGCSPAQVMGVVSACSMVVAMRLHALIFAASAGVPALGISYDPKVESFLAAAGQDHVSLDDVTSGLLAGRVMESWERRDVLSARLAEAVPPMRALAERNFTLAAEMLG